MTYEEFRQSLCLVDVSKECLSFLADRIESDDYRGIQCSQHNRYDLSVIETVLAELYRLVGREKMTMRTTDLSKRPVNLPEESVYAVYVDALSRKLGRCTQDSVRKNLLVDMHRMGLVERYKPDGTPIGPYETGKKKYVRISELGLDLLDESHTLLEKRLRYTRAIDTLTQGLADKLLKIAELDGEISETEFQFFLSFYGKTLKGHCYTGEELVDYIREFRRLSRFQREYAVKLVKEYCDPKAFAGDKRQKRDYHNWLNETQQIFMLLGQTAYYKVSGNRLRIRVGRDALYETPEKLVRSTEEKKKYFKQHGIEKTKGFELHHMVPLCWARTALEFSLLDVWENLIYLDGYKHAVITQNGNNHVRLDFSGEDLRFTDFSGNTLCCAYGENVLYSPVHRETMRAYNRELLQSCGR